MPAMPRSPDRRNLLNFNVGDRIGNYIFLGKRSKRNTHKRAQPLGTGGSAEVYLVGQHLHRKFDVPRAIKLFVYRDDVAKRVKRVKPRLGTPISRDEFLQEIVNFTQLNHEGLVKIIDAGVHPYAPPGSRSQLCEIPYIVTDYIEGITLQDLLRHAPGSNNRDKSPIGAVHYDLRNHPSQILSLLTRLARAINFMHDRSFYHCDIAPKNVFLNKNDSYHPILGDLGLGLCVREKRATVRIAGTVRYMPPEISKSYGKRVSWEEFSGFQPHWDLFSFAKTGLELCSIVTDKSNQKWLQPLIDTLHACLNGRKYKTINDLLRQLEWLQPVDRVPELGDGLSGRYKRIIPINSPSLSRRLKRLSSHPGLLRLERLNQLTLARGVFPGARHSRYEHALGTLEAMRRYLLAVVDGPDFLTRLNPSAIETALLAALFSNSTRVPFHHITSDIKGVLPKDEHVLRASDAYATVFGELYNKNGETLNDIISNDFPDVDPCKLRSIILGEKGAFTSNEERLIYSMLNCSLDVRVADFIRRDSSHVGLSGFTFDLEELLGELTVVNERLALRGRGIGIAEQVIVMRYWLFNRVYWNSPNRALVTMLRFALHRLSERNDFLKKLRASILDLSDDEAIGFCLAYAKEKRIPEIVNVLELVMAPEQQLFRPIVQASCHELTFLSGSWQKACTMNYPQLLALADGVQSCIMERLGVDSVIARRLILADVPPDESSAKSKLGQDIIIANDDDERQAKTLSSVSDLVSGINQGFTKNLRKLRIFIHPTFWENASSNERGLIHTTTIEYLKTLD